MTTELPIVVYSDVICPWCFVGKRRLETALAAPGMPAARFLWRPFELNPGMPPQGVDRQSYRARKFGAAGSAARDAEMARIGAELGIAFAFARMERTPNTRLAHRLIWEAERQGRQDALVERLFKAYFEEGADIGVRQVLEGLAAEAGLETEGVRQALDAQESLAAVVASEREGYDLGIAGVPFFILPGASSVSGAQPPDFWREVLPRVAARAAASVSADG
jgi:predicted DsbA family dithiol-disulfide isomerase